MKREPATEPTDEVTTDVTQAEPGRTELSGEKLDSILAKLSGKGAGLWRTQRISTRHGVLNQALVWRAHDEQSGGPIRTQLVSLSSSGIGFLSGEPFDPAERITFEMAVENEGHLQWTCRVRWCEATEDGLHRVGAQFVGIS